VHLEVPEGPEAHGHIEAFVVLERQGVPHLELHAGNVAPRYREHALGPVHSHDPPPERVTEHARPCPGAARHVEPITPIAVERSPHGLEDLRWRAKRGMVELLCQEVVPSAGRGESLAHELGECGAFWMEHEAR